MKTLAWAARAGAESLAGMSVVEMCADSTLGRLPHHRRAHLRREMFLRGYVFSLISESVHLAGQNVWDGKRSCEFGGPIRRAGPPLPLILRVGHLSQQKLLARCEQRESVTPTFTMELSFVRHARVQI
eukprot:3273625-Pleurochrysis_carterae.AAC.1